MDLTYILQTPIYISPRRLIDEKIQCTVFSTRQLPVVNKKCGWGWGLIQKIALFNLEFEYTRQLHANWLNIMNSCNECPICFEVKKLHRLSCGHNICKICLKQMLTRSTSLHKRPLCRAPIGKEHFAQCKIVYDASYTPSDQQISQPLTARDLERFHNMGTGRTINAIAIAEEYRAATEEYSARMRDAEYRQSEEYRNQHAIIRGIVARAMEQSANNITSDDIDIVSRSAGVSIGAAGRALISSGGNLVQAMMSLI